MASIDRIAYPQFRRTVSVRELREKFTPADDEVAWAREKSRTEHHLLALLVWLKAYGRLGYFLDLSEVPPPIHDSARTAERHRDWVRERLGVTYDPSAARALAQRVIREAVRSKDRRAGQSRGGYAARSGAARSGAWTGASCPARAWPGTMA